MTARPAKVTLISVATLVVLVACGQTPILTTARSFDRPGRTALVCFDVSVTPPVAVALSRCAPVDVATGTLPTGFDLHALVLQSRRGEIAVVDLRTNAILDTNATIPGFTFVEAGALPVDLVASRGLSADRALTTYVANAGTEDIWVFSTSKFRAPATTGRADSQRVSLGGPPSAVVLTPDEGFLIVALPTLGLLRQFPIMGDTGLIEEAGATDVPLASLVPPPLRAEPEAVLYERVCSAASLALPTAAPERVARVAGMTPSPVALLVDEQTQELLVGDSSLPVVHRFAIGVAGVGAEAEPFAIGTPVRDLALTPLVPSTIGGDAARRYLYALDDTGAVAVMDLSDPVGFPAGRPLSIEIPTARSQDRITFGSPATALTMVATPDYNPAAPNACTPGTPTTETKGPARLHGVFLIASLTDGSIRFVDVYDRDIGCRGSAGLCADTAAATGDAIVYLRRHRPRIGLLVSNEIGVIGAPTMSVAGVPFAIAKDGTAASNSAPGLTPLTSCAGLNASFVQGYPAEEDAPLVCALGDPWAATQERWTATYEGTIFSGVAGRFDAAGPNFIAGGTDFCRAVVLGTALREGIVVPGDQLVITGDLPPGQAAANPECARLVANDVGMGSRVIIGFEIISANDMGMLELGDTALGAPDITRAFVRDCFSELVTFEIRARETWIVRGSFSGLVRAAPVGSGVCVAPTMTPENEGKVFRAKSNEAFVSRALAFQINVDPMVPARPGMTLSFDLGGLPAGLGVDLTPGTLSGSIPTDVFYSSVDNRLYAIDAGRASLTRIAIENVSVERLFQ